ncbi:hypothetical protein FEM48_Zijuj07G0169500 [Ziziphus jujuba var. spinosa]|uniref:Uncharacterized protein n=1 Tax=Ziziphus jujuba var. spinosa TaxID=714518 RepID=A0A978V5U7_ZIZJJ|nr:hypothetical protein FEM48_Zijuj07G0169500 [Ziziphus jujuba var. spinosa]
MPAQKRSLPDNLSDDEEEPTNHHHHHRPKQSRPQPQPEDEAELLLQVGYLRTTLATIAPIEVVGPKSSVATLGTGHFFLSL